MASSTTPVIPPGFDVSALAGFDLFNKDTVTDSVVTVNIVFLIIVPIIVALRVFVRVSVMRSLGLDDSMIFPHKHKHPLAIEHY